MDYHGTPQRMRPPPGQVGSTPFRSSSNNRFQSSLVPKSRPSPARPFQPQNKPSGFSSTNRDLFRASTPKSSRTARFAPNLPTDATNASPGGRKYLPQKSVMGGMTSTASADLFKMRIPSPDPELTGEALAREVPQDPNRKGSIYADQFLSHKCPSHFDELQRRQFFCILDLRRLKYAADEIFAKKDWKLNILNFAKEYEKSRGLILLRYGLYEFKKVKPSEEVLKRWRKTHNLPDPEPETEEDQTRRTAGVTTGATKRKAEDDLAPKDNALMASSTANQNKRRNVEAEESDGAPKGPAPFKKSKRKVDADDETDENQPSKTPKATPSAAQSKFESILNKTQSPAKRAPLGASTMSANPFGATKSTETETNATTKSNPFGTSSTVTKSTTSVFSNVGASSTGSILSNHQPGSKLPANSGNVFGYLSESSAHSSNNENNDGSDSEPEENESQGVAPSYEPSAAASTGTNTPPVQNGSSMFPADPSALFKKAAKPVEPASTDASSLFKNLNKPAEPAPAGGLFDRVQKGTDGQPLRGTPGAEDDHAAPASIFGAPKESAQPPKKALGGDFTYDASSTPIKFGAAPVSKDANGTAPTPAPQASKETERPAETAAAPSIFGSQPQKSQPAPASIFGASKPAATNGAASIFGAQKTPATPAGLPSTSSSSVFQGFGKPKETDTPAAKPPATLFGQKPAGAAAPPPATPLFGGVNKDTDSGANKPSFGSDNKSSATSIFGANTSNGFGTADKSKTDKPATAAPTFGAQSTTSSTPAFGGGSKRRATEDDDEPPAKKPAPSMFGGAAAAPSSTPRFMGNGGSTSTLFGNAQPAQTEKKPDTMTAPKNMFGSAPAATPNTTSTSESKPAQPIFSFGSDSGNAAKPAATPAPIFSFGGNNTTTSQAPSFGGSTTPAASNSFDFNFSGAGAGGSSNGNSSAPFQFGQSTSGGGSGTFNFGAGGGATPATPTANFSFGQQQSTQQQASTTPAGSFTFGQQQSTPQPSTTPAASFSFGQQQSTPKPASTTPAQSIFGGGSQPSFNFTSATPTQNTPGGNDAKPTSIFGNLAPSGGTGTNSPMFAPSSMGTTPAGGTPEPQAKPEDGEEAPQEQVSLTNGGPGEEDEEIVHEVRAKAMKFIPAGKDSDDEGSDKKKSPWTTMGVGPLRVLKNKTTGSVRILLRAEPRGHIAMNKTILADVAYKATQKTINFAAASDDGSGLETWVLQVKKPESATELAGVLEANKAANKN